MSKIFFKYFLINLMGSFDLVGKLECVWKVGATCGEGPIWIDAEQSLILLILMGKNFIVIMLNLRQSVV